ncbi:DUF6049 family protein [Varibaculum cambriense]|uniref:DUF6049 family protein n=1 Tax=Varibaculum cambriense TaxID=184870 RepID=UPI0029070691|nr:DUF6049 family protein [Varibaculum cambriense]MDU5541314.1 DUF6049 family protein [Varibaculum cambriense]
MTISRLRGRVFGVVVTVLLTLCCTFNPGSPPVAKAAPQSPAPQLTAVITAISPDTLSYKEDEQARPEKVTVTGTVSNHTAAPVNNVLVQVSTTSRLGGDAETIRTWVKGESDRGMGVLRLQQSKTLTQVPAKKTVKFAIEIPASTLPALNKDSLGSLGVQASVSASKVKRKNTRGDRSLLLYAPETESPAKSSLAIIAPLSASSPEIAKWLTRKGIGSEATASTQTSNLVAEPLKSVDANAKLLSNLSTTGITWVVDPALLHANSPLLTGSFAPLPEKPAPLSLDPVMLDALKAAQAKGASVSLDLWGAPDLVQLDKNALAKAAEGNRQLGALLENELTLAPSTIFLANPHWAGRTDTICTNSENRLSEGCVLVTGGDQLPLTQGYNYQPDLLGQAKTGDQTRQFLADHGTLSALLASSSTEDAFTNTQVARAMLAAIASERPSQPRLINAVLPNGALDSAVTQQRISKILSDSWVKGTALPQALGADPTSVTLGTNPKIQNLAPDTPGALGVAGSSFHSATKSLNTARERVVPSLEQIAPDHQRITAPLYQQLLLSTSRAMTSAERNQAITNAGSELDLLARAVQIQTSSQINLIASSSQIPIKVLNRLPVEVNVRLKLQPTDSRLRADSTVAVSLAPKGSRTVKIPITAVRNGNVRVKVAILPQTGNLVLDQQQQIDLRIRTGWEDRIFLGFIFSAAAIFIVGLIVNFRRGTRMEQE